MVSLKARVHVVRLRRLNVNTAHPADSDQEDGGQTWYNKSHEDCPKLQKIMAM